MDILKQPMLIPVREPSSFVSIPLSMAIHCDNCDTVSVAVSDHCGVCGSSAILPLSFFLKPVSDSQRAA